MTSLPSYRELKSRLSLEFSEENFINESRQNVRAILDGRDPRLMLIVGPCSIHDPHSAKEYAAKLNHLAKAVSPHFYLLMRVYCEKPRTSKGWKGFLYDPLLDGSHAIRLGIESTRQLLIELAQLKIPAATEFSDPAAAFYYDDLISWGSIGARTSSSQIHRQLASDLSMPIGFKNGLAGNISSAINGVLAAADPHYYLRSSENGILSIQLTKGNPDGHVVLRGGENGPNFDASIVSDTLAKLGSKKLLSRLLIDCSHHNSGKNHEHQANVFRSVIHQVAEGNRSIRGLMLESHLYGGSQSMPENPACLKYGISITDPCLDWISTAALIKWGAEHLENHLSAAQQINAG